MEFIDYYKILGIDKNATGDEIKKAYRKLARKLHPDLNPNDKEAHQKFQKINEANEVLIDPAKRKKYDQYGKDWQHADQFEQQRRSADHTQPGGAQDFPVLATMIFPVFLKAYLDRVKGGSKKQNSADRITRQN